MATYRIDSAQSPIGIDAESSMHPVRATSTSLAGTVDVELDDQGRPDLDKPYGARMSLPIDSIQSGHGVQDREMKRRLDTKKFPTIDVEVTHAERLDGNGRYRAKARVTVRGEAREVEGDVNLTVDGDRLIVEGQQTIDMRLFGIEPPKILMMKVYPDVVVRVRVTAQRQQ